MTRAAADPYVPLSLSSRLHPRVPGPAPAGRAPEPVIAGFVGVFSYSRRAFELVWSTSHALTAALVLLTLVGGVLPAAVAYVGALIVDQVVHAISVVKAGGPIDYSRVLWFVAAVTNSRPGHEQVPIRYVTALSRRKVYLATCRLDVERAGSCAVEWQRLWRGNSPRLLSVVAKLRHCMNKLGTISGLSARTAVVRH